MCLHQHHLSSHFSCCGSHKPLEATSSRVGPRAQEDLNGWSLQWWQEEWIITA